MFGSNTGTFGGSGAFGAKPASSGGFGAGFMGTGGSHRSEHISDLTHTTAGANTNPVFGAPSGGASSPFGSGFKPATTSGTGVSFGGTAPVSSFGSTSPSTMTAFGTANRSTSPGGFGGFGSNVSGFGSGSKPLGGATSPFGGGTVTGFGATPSASPFQGSSAFGSTSTSALGSSNPFGASTTSTSFGSPTAFGSSSGTGAFGQVNDY